MANRGMGVAVDIVVILEHVIDFLSVPCGGPVAIFGGEFLADRTKVQYRAQGVRRKLGFYESC
jgi:hypothetical protein